MQKKKVFYISLCVVNAILTGLVIAFVYNNRAQGRKSWDWGIFSLSFGNRMTDLLGNNIKKRTKRLEL